VHLNEIEGQKEERSAQGAIEEERHQIDAAEGAGGEHIERHHRGTAVPFDPDECHEQQQAGRDRAQHHPIGPAEIG
jgi:hypothetical protein